MSNYYQWLDFIIRLFSNYKPIYSIIFHIVITTIYIMCKKKASIDIFYFMDAYYEKKYT